MRQELAELLSKSFTRTKERFWTFFFLFILVFIPSFFLGLLVVSAIAYPKILYLTIAGLSGLAVLIFYFWFSLAAVDVVIAEKKQSVWETVGKMKARVWGFIWFNLLYTVFVVGLLPLGVVTVGVVLILWPLWSVFATFIYLEKGKKGLDNLWVSRAMVVGRFWSNAGKIALIAGPVFILGLLLGLIKNDVLNVVFQFFYAVFVAPFITSFLYELYKTLPEAHTAKPPKVWIILSLIGWIFVILFAVILLMVWRESNFTPCIELTRRRPAV